MTGIIKRGLGFAMAGAATMVLASCASTPSVRHSTVAPKQATKEYFAEKTYGVKASPRVTNQRSRLKRGGGRLQVGKPYQVKGKWYYPKEEPGYTRTGQASWYGDAFHGRLTANGEIYDMTHLSAAHPTMPLPSYARVTNTTNGSSVIVRVNDRGPFHGGRVIDLSKRAAELLDYTKSGVAQVKVDYVGPAPLHGQDDEYLIASYQPSGVKTDPTSIGQPSGVILAMAAPAAPSAQPSVVSVRRPGEGLPGVVRANSFAPANTAPLPVGSVVPVAATPAIAPSAVPVLPDTIPVPSFRPGILATAKAPVPALGYAPERMHAGSQAIDQLIETSKGRLDAAGLQQAFARTGRVPATGDYVVVGTYAGQAKAEAVHSAVKSAGQAVITATADGYTVNVVPLNGQNCDTVVSALWSKGFGDAFTVRQ